MIFYAKLHSLRSINIDHNFFELGWILFGEAVPDWVNHDAVFAGWQNLVFNLESVHKVCPETASDKLPALLHQNDIEFGWLKRLLKIVISERAKAVTLLKY